jgi:hypothetical protein
MTTSTHADAQRGMGFLYSLIRLNVTTSRARQTSLASWQAGPSNLVRRSTARLLLNTISRRDPVDRDDVKYGREKVSEDTDFDTDLLLTLVRDFSKGLSGVELQKIEMTKTEIGVDFGEIELHWWRDEGGF